jgi:hypothetical protein
MICFRLKVETLIIPFRLIPLFLCFNLVQSPIDAHIEVKDIAKWVGNSPEIIYRHYAAHLRSLAVPEL